MKELTKASIRDIISKENSFTLLQNAVYLALLIPNEVVLRFILAVIFGFFGVALKHLLDVEPKKLNYYDEMSRRDNVSRAEEEVENEKECGYLSRRGR